MANPFVFGKIVNKTSFCNRKEEIKILKTHISNSYSVWLFAPRRYGKSSLIKRVFNEITEVKTIYFDLYNIQTLDNFCRRYSNVIARELFNWKDDIKNISSQIKSYFTNLSPKISFDENGSPSLALIQQEINLQEDIETILNLPEKIAQEKGVKICIAFDEFQEINRIDKFIINWMRSAFQNQKNVSYVFLGSKQSLMQSVFSSLNSPFYEYAVKMDIKPLPQNDLFNFIKQKFNNNNVEVKDKTINEILDKSNCHPHFTQYFASVVYDEIISGSNQDNNDFTKNWMSKIINSQSVIFQNIYDQLTTNQRKILLTLANTMGNELFSNKTKDKFKLPGSSSLSTSLNSLVKKDLVSKNNSNYIITNPVFNEWLKYIYSF